MLILGLSHSSIKNIIGFLTISAKLSTMSFAKTDVDAGLLYWIVHVYLIKWTPSVIIKVFKTSVELSR